MRPIDLCPHKVHTLTHSDTSHFTPTCTVCTWPMLSDCLTTESSSGIFPVGSWMFIEDTCEIV